MENWKKYNFNLTKVKLTLPKVKNCKNNKFIITNLFTDNISNQLSLLSNFYRHQSSSGFNSRTSSTQS